MITPKFTGTLCDTARSYNQTVRLMYDDLSTKNYLFPL